MHAPPPLPPATGCCCAQFYERDLRARMLSQAFNTKPYNDFDGQAFVVHFHGPKVQAWSAARVGRVGQGLHRRLLAPGGRTTASPARKTYMHLDVY